MKTDKALLAIDTATGGCSAAIAVDGVITAERRLEMRRGHSEHLIGMIGEVMTEAGIAYDDLDAVIVTRGPGAFTGLRIGLATARAIALAAGIQSFGITTLAVIAAAARRIAEDDLPVLAAVDSRRAEPYAQLFSGGRAMGEPVAATDETIAGLIPSGDFTIAGDGAAKLLPILPHAPLRQLDLLPDAAEAARLAASVLASGGTLDPAEPLYIRPPDAVTTAEAQAARRAKQGR